jgi:hypothetical protein
MSDKEVPEEKSGKDEIARPPEDAVTIASLLRDKKTGNLMVLMDEQCYSNFDEIGDPETRSRLEYAVSDLKMWLAASGTSPQAAMETTPLEAELTATKPISMIDGINAILERRAIEGEIQKGLRLFVGPDGAVRVFVGVNSYEVDKVRDKRTREIIKEAVAEWEAHQ